ncbi:MAG: glycosyltransferase family 4 protein, partial [Patescibacteria group bacterium]|nr:glycosyltransferase family 4 protein [Patescibacteria group bacterium]
TGIVAGWGVSAARLKRIYLGLPPLPPAREPADRPAGRLLVSIGRFVPWKGFGLLIDLLPDLPGWQLALVGDGPLAPALKAQAAARGVSERVRFTGALSRAEALGWLACADAFALNTAFESFSFQVLEAMLAGAPVIATTVGSLPELIDNGVEGVLLAPSDRAGFLEAIRSVERDPETWAARRAAARRASADFSLGASAGAFAEAIMTVCA